ncbi:hypothetical protein M3Y98_00993600 [Aphelenchoides besseyi]|nr:hypothetical protein M3Y98_00993600 [Aphelenchoides besseyi]
MKLLLLLFLFVFVNSKVYREVQLTDSGVHSFPRFDKNGTSIHVVANGGQYETDCDHVYRIDLRTPQQPTGLVSLGIGQEDGPSFGTSIFSSTNLYGIRTAGENQGYGQTKSLINGFDAVSDSGDARVLFHAPPVGNDGPALKAGVEVLDKYEIYETTWNDLANGNFKVENPVVQKPTNGYLTNPRFLRDGTSRFFYTFTDMNGNSQIKLHTPGQANASEKNRDEVVLDQAKDIDVFYKDSTIYVTYISNKNGKNWQVYMDTYNADTHFPTVSLAPPVSYESGTPYFEDTKVIFQMDLRVNRTDIARRLSPGLRYHESPAFIGLDGLNDIYMVSRISDSGICQLPNANNRWKCYNNPCNYLTIAIEILMETTTCTWHRLQTLAVQHE